MLDPGFLLDAYASGFFPMADEESGKIGWYSPDPRAVIPLDGFHISRSLRRTVRRNIFRITFDEAFPKVIEECAARPVTWISGEIVNAYKLLHQRGYGHSVECWKESVMVGGLYGVALGSAFFGESMFSREPDASKVALVHLVEHLRRRGFLLLDTQFLNPHIAGFGGTLIPRSEYLRLLKKAIASPARF
jgi:leucyl/phenylalanyl-tRNA--protein transferase